MIVLKRDHLNFKKFNVIYQLNQINLCVQSIRLQSF